jgi:hypothetical protein
MYGTTRNCLWPNYRLHETTGFVDSSVDRVFAYIDDHTRLSSHMSEPSWRMGWGYMTTELDEGQGQRSDDAVKHFASPA